MKYNVYFRHSSSKETLLDTVEENDIYSVIKSFCDDHDFTIYYTRYWEKDGEKWYDVGSHTEFFIARSIQ